ncbi:hypothetical protein V8C86DRAFT_3118639 [Haematococcus lacustris]
MEPSWDAKEQGGQRGPGPGGAEHKRGEPAPQADCSPREPQEDNAKLKDSKTAHVELS